MENPAAIPKSGLKIKNRCTQEGVNRQNLASIRKSGPEIKNHRTMEDVSGQIPAAIPKFTPSNPESMHDEGCFRSKPCSDSQLYPLKSRIIARWRVFPGKTQQRFPSLPPQIQNHCTIEGISGQNPAAIRKFEPEIQNHCTMEGISGRNPAAIANFTPSNQESLHARSCKRGNP